MNMTFRDLCCLGPAAILLAASTAQATVTASSDAKVTVTVDCFFVDDIKTLDKPAKLNIIATTKADASTSRGDHSKDKDGKPTGSDGGSSVWDWTNGVQWKPGQGLWIHAKATAITDPVGWAWHDSKGDTSLKISNDHPESFITVRFKVAWEWTVKATGSDPKKEQGVAIASTTGDVIDYQTGATKEYPPGGTIPGKGEALLDVELDAKSSTVVCWNVSAYARVAANATPSPTGFLTLCGGFLAIGRRRRST